MKLFHAPGSCSLGIRLLLEEIGAPYEIDLVDVQAGQQREPAYLAVNPKGKVPALLRDNGVLLTKYPAIAFWLARNYPAAGLLPSDADGEAPALELLEFIVASLHMRGTALIMRPSAFASSAEAQVEVTQIGRDVVERGVSQLSREIGSNPYLLGDHFTLPDSAAFYLLTWLSNLEVPVGDVLTEYFHRLAARPSAQATQRG